MSTIKILFVGTGPISYDISPYVTLNEMMEINELSEDDYYYLTDFKSVDFSTGQARVYMSDIPREYLKYFRKKLEIHDLDRQRDLIAIQIKKWYSKCEIIEYTSCDMYIVEPEYFGKSVITYTQNKDDEFYQKHNIKMQYKSHHHTTFQNFIQTNNIKYDLVWFMGCCNPHYLFETNTTFIKNFKNTLVKNAYILYSDPYAKSVKYKHDLIDFKVRFIDLCADDPDKDIKPNDHCKINYMFDKLNVIDIGVYKFK